MPPLTPPRRVRHAELAAGGRLGRSADSHFSAIQPRLACALRADAVAHRGRARTARVAPLPAGLGDAASCYWFGVCYWIQFVLVVYGGLGDPLSWARFLLFCLAKALHMGCVHAAAGILMRRWWAIPAVAALWVAIEVTHGPLGFAWLALGNAGIDMGVPLRLAPLHGRLRDFVCLRLMSAAIGADRAAPSTHCNCCGCAALPFLIFPASTARRAPRPARPRCWCSRIFPKTEEWTTDSVLRLEEAQTGRNSPCAAC